MRESRAKKPSNPAKKAKMTEELRQEAAALKRLFEEHQGKAKMQGDRVTQASFGAAHEIGDQGLVTQYLNGIIPLNLRVAAAFAKGLSCRIEEFSPRLAVEAQSLADVIPPSAPAPTQQPLEDKGKLLSFLDLDRIEAQLVAMYRDLNSELREELLQYANRLHNEAHPSASPSNPYGRKAKKEHS